jgi:LiaF transmembrane domain
MATSPRPESLVLGLGLIALGTAWTLSNLGRLDMLATLHTWWPLALVVWGALELYETHTARSASSAPPAGEGARPAGREDPSAAGRDR